VSITQPHVAIITVTYNSHDFIEAYLTSITPFITHGTHRLFIIDNNSTDNTCQLIKQYRQQHQLLEHIHIIELPKNIGFGKGCNAGIEAAKTYSPSHYWLLNPDTKVFDNSGDALLSFMQQHPNVDFAGSVLVNSKQQPRAGAFRFPMLTNVILSTLKLGFLDKHFNQYTTAIPISDNPYTADWLTGASFMTKAECLYQLNGFDPAYFLYFEEVDLFYRAKKAHLSVWACPSSHVFHISGASTGINDHKKAVKRLPSYWFESRRHYYSSNHGTLYFALTDTALILCKILWKIRAKIQNKEDDTPPYFIGDIIKHSILKNIFGFQRSTHYK
jgi:N-acetylglucosaminyl-diphospho-decaprenol L-rhamnosyltransferase